MMQQNNLRFHAHCHFSHIMGAKVGNVVNAENL